jgi:hypothetical protein
MVLPSARTFSEGENSTFAPGMNYVEKATIAQQKAGVHEENERGK